MNTIVEALNQTLEELRKQKDIQSKGHFVFKSTIIPDIKYPIYKVCTFELYYVLGKLKDKVISIQDTIRMPEGGGDLRELKIKFCKELFILSSGDTFDKYINDLFD